MSHLGSVLLLSNNPYIISYHGVNCDVRMRIHFIPYYKVFSHDFARLRPLNIKFSFLFQIFKKCIDFNILFHDFNCPFLTERIDLRFPIKQSICRKSMVRVPCRAVEITFFIVYDCVSIYETLSNTILNNL